MFSADLHISPITPGQQHRLFINGICIFCMEKVLMSENELVLMSPALLERANGQCPGEGGKEVVGERGISFEVGVWCLL